VEALASLERWEEATNSKASLAPHNPNAGQQRQRRPQRPAISLDITEEFCRLLERIAGSVQHLVSPYLESALCRDSLKGCETMTVGNLMGVARGLHTIKGQEYTRPGSWSALFGPPA